MKIPNQKSQVLLTALLFTLMAGSIVQAQPSSANSISFQGALTGAGGQPLANGNYNLTFKFYDVPTGSTALATSNVPNVAVTGGIASTPIPVDAAWFNGQTRYLGIAINGGTELEPRVLVTAVPYAISADSVKQVVVIGSNGNVGIRTTSPRSAFDAVGGVFARTLGLAAASVVPSQHEYWAIEPDTWINGDLIINRHHDGDQPNESRSLYFHPNGNVGINTWLPQATLDVNGTAHFNGSVGIHTTSPRSTFDVVGGVFARAINLGVASIVPATDKYWSIEPDLWRTGDLVINRHHDGDQANESRSLYFHPDGLVGINTWFPQATLDVNGTARMTVCQITSDRAAKDLFAPVRTRDILAKLAGLPISTWAYTNNLSIRHIGPVAQDFAAAFGLGDDDKHIATVDADGVALAAIQGLHQLVREKDAKIHNLEKRLEALERKLESRFAAQERP